jgi:putative ABC transport system substrate-binding protein
MPRIGVLVGYASGAEDPLALEMRRPFQEAMQAAGWIDGKTIHVDYRYTAGDAAKTEAAAAELVALAPDLIYALGLPSAQAVSARTRTIPIVFSRTADPVRFGLVASINRPGGNVTGFMAWDFSIGGKWMQLLRQIAPDLRHVGITYNPETGSYAPPLIASARAAAGTDVAVVEYQVHDEREMEAAATTLGQKPHGALLAIPEPFANFHRDQIIGLAARFSLPALLSVTGATKRGALMSYTYSPDAMQREPVSYIDRILRGASAGGLPVQAPTKFELSINLKTASALGLTVPPSLLALADEVFE